MKVDFNKEWAQKHSKAEFVKQHEHHADDVDLGEAWEELQKEKAPKAKKPDAEVEKSK